MDNKGKNISKIKKWLSETGMTLDDIGIEDTFETMSEDVIISILEDIAEDEAREQGRKLEEMESLEYMLDEEDWIEE